LAARGLILGGIRKGADCIAAIEGNAISGLSVGMCDTVSEMAGGVKHIRKAHLVEASVVYRPANPLAVLHKSPAAKSFSGIALSPALGFEYK
jgi:hypothetical protein